MMVNEDTGTIRAQAAARASRGKRERRILALGAIIGAVLMYAVIACSARMFGVPPADAHTVKPPAEIITPTVHVVPQIGWRVPEVRGSTIPWMPGTVTRWLPVIRTHCRGIDEELAQIIILVESGGNANAVSHANAQGLMQVVPRWHPGWTDKTAAGNIAYGCRYMGELIAKRGVAGGVYSYNSGNVATAEGRRYVAWVTGMAAERHAADSPTFRRWLAAGGAALVERANNG